MYDGFLPGLKFEKKVDEYNTGKCKKFATNI